MKVLYVGRHDQVRSNQDEEAITDALSSLGHEVQRLRESMGHNAYKLANRWADVCLINKWDAPEHLMRISCRKVCWYFDLVNWPGDPSLDGRCATRMRWMERNMPYLDLLFCTDGDWVWGRNAEDGRVIHLMQGADQRVVGRGVPNGQRGRILLTGIGRGGGKDRLSFVEEMKAKWGKDFTHVERGAHGRELQSLIAGHDVVVAPDAPVTDRYWSNRVYLMLGYGAFLLHPYTRGIAQHYVDERELVYYRGRDDLHSKITHYLKQPGDRWRISEAGLQRTVTEHTYRHRVEEMMRVVKERLF